VRETKPETATEAKTETERAGVTMVGAPKVTVLVRLCRGTSGDGRPRDVCRGGHEDAKRAPLPQGRQSKEGLSFASIAFFYVFM
jgi:hypothetical protein